MSTITYKCPCCGAPLAFQGASGKLECASCGNHYDLDAIEAMNIAESSEGVRFDMSAETFDADDADQMQAYACESCGAELMTDGTTTATECPYCGSPAILPERIDGGVKPDMVVPFIVSKEQAQKQFENYFKGKKLLPNIFKGRNRISQMRRLFVPYWLFDCTADGNIVYDAEKSRTERHGDWETTYTKHYVVHRKGRMAFESIPVDGSEKLDNRITESLEPYDLTKAVPFAPAVLAGAMADHADVDAQACESRAIERVETSMSDALRDTVSGYSSVQERSRNIHAEGGKVAPVLLPIWLITTEKEGKTYTFAINGQTGKLTCDVPADKGKAFVWGAGVFAGVFAIAALLAAMMDSSSMIVPAVIALIAALCVVFGLIAQLKQAQSQSKADDYVKEDSFDLEVCTDHFLYESKSRRKIETKDNKKD